MSQTSITLNYCYYLEMIQHSSRGDGLFSLSPRCGSLCFNFQWYILILSSQQKKTSIFPHCVKCLLRIKLNGCRFEDEFYAPKVPIIVIGCEESRSLMMIEAFISLSPAGRGALEVLFFGVISCRVIASFLSITA